MRTLSDKELVKVSGAGYECPTSTKGNNGWGNGGDDGINSPKVDDGFKVTGDSTGAAGITGGGQDKLAR